MKETFYRLAASGLVPRRWFAPDLPPNRPAPPSDRPLEIEVVSHCWRYHHLLVYQLSSLVLHPPRETSVQMTVFYSEEDAKTLELLEYFGSKEVPGVEWNWWPLEKTRLFRRSLGRNLAARSTRADWLWLSDCDVIFHRGAVDAAGHALRGQTEALVFPRVHRMTEMLEPDHPILTAGEGAPRILDLDTSSGFTPDVRGRAVGGFQIVRGDVARAIGYCGTIDFYQQPIPEWRRTHDDRVFRWLLGTEGSPIDAPGLYRIRHLSKGRKSGQRR